MRWFTLLFGYLDFRELGGAVVPPLFIMEKIYLLTVGNKSEAFYTLKKLCQSIGIDHKGLKEKLPFLQGSFSIKEINLS